MITAVFMRLALPLNGFETIMVNCNPETVSTDFDTSDRLYFEPLARRCIENYSCRKTLWRNCTLWWTNAIKVSKYLHENGVNIIGTSADSIDAAEDRERFQKILQQLNLKQPNNRIARNAIEISISQRSRISISSTSFLCAGW